MNKVLIIGGAGYIGTVLTDYLLSLKYSVRSLDNFIYKNNSTIIPFIGRKGYEFMHGDLCDIGILDKALHNVDHVIILAGLVGDPITKKYPKESKLINELGIQNCIKFLNGKGLKKVVFVSTCSNYGILKSGEIANETYDLKPLSLYAKAKVSCEKYILSLKGHTDYCPIILRFATAFGISPRMRFDLTVNEFTRELAIGNELVVFDELTWRPYCHIRDFATLIELVLIAEDKNVRFQVYNAGADVNNYTKKGLVDQILRKVPSGKVNYKKEGSDPRNYRVNFSKVKNAFGFIPRYTVKDGINELLEALNNQIFIEEDNSAIRLGNYTISYKI